jgi:predicted metalloendopeptidase
MVGTQSYLVNAFYTPSNNSIYIPLAYIQKPFVDLDERGIEYNLASVGYTLCHEICHALDDMGSYYDYKGNIKNWWTETDRKKYKIIMDDISKQYEFFAKRDNIDYNASVGIGENIADIVGLRVCQEYLYDFQLKNKDIIPVNSLSFQAFFIYYAVLQKQFVNKKAIVHQLLSNPHPLSKYRTNVPLSRLELFIKLYNVKKGDGMWWHNTCSVFDQSCKKVL